MAFTFNIILPVPVTPAIQPNARIRRHRVVAERQRQIGANFLRGKLTVIAAIIHIETTLEIIVHSQGNRFVEGILQTCFRFDTGISVTGSVQIVGKFIHRQPTVET